MTKSHNEVSLETVYNLVDKKISEVNSSVIRLENKFDNLEAGRLSRLEGTVADLKGRFLVTGAVIAFIISVALQLIGVYLKK